jgi:nitrogen fixation protein NifX
MSTARHLRVLDSGTDDGFLATALKVAFTSTNMTDVDQHFGAAESVVIYAVNPDQARLLEVAEFTSPKLDESEDKLAAKLDALDGCVAVYTNAVVRPSAIWSGPCRMNCDWGQAPGWRVLST